MWGSGDNFLSNSTSRSCKAKSSVSYTAIFCNMLKWNFHTFGILKKSTFYPVHRRTNGSTVLKHPLYSPTFDFWAVDINLTVQWFRNFHIHKMIHQGLPDKKNKNVYKVSLHFYTHIRETHKMKLKPLGDDHDLIFYDWRETMVDYIIF